MTIVNPVPPLEAYVPPYMPINDIAPFTYPDGLSYLQVLQELRRFINQSVVPFVNTQFDTLGTDFSTQVNSLITTVNDAIALLESNVNSAISTSDSNVAAEIAANHTDVAAQLQTLTDYVNQQVAAIQASGIVVSDPVIDGVLSNVATASRVLLDSLYGKKSDVTSALTRIGNLETTPYMYAPTYGIAADGTDESAKVTAFIAAATTAGATAVFKRNSVVCAASTINVPSGARINLNGATIKQIDTANVNLRLITIASVTDVHLFNGTLDGNTGAYAGAVSEFRHNVLITNSTDIKLYDLYSKNAHGDGIYVGDNLTGISQRIFLDRVRCDSNYRNGMSISHVSGMRVNDSIFTNTIGTAPQAGVDIEPNVTNIACEDIRFVNCTFSGNAADGLRVSLQANPTARQGGFMFYGCVSTSNTINGYSIRDALELSIIGGSSESNGQYGVKLEHGYGTLVRGVKLIGVNLKKNGREGFLANSDTQINNVSLVDCTIISNSQSAAGGYMGVWINPQAGSINLLVSGCFFDDVSQHYHLRTASTIANVTLVGNRYMAADPGGGTILLADDSTSRVQFESYGFRGPSGTTAQRPSAGVVYQGGQYFDTTLGKPIFSTGATGTGWKDATGATV